MTANFTDRNARRAAASRWFAASLAIGFGLAACDSPTLLAAGAPCTGSSECAADLLCDFGQAVPVCSAHSTVADAAPPTIDASAADASSTDASAVDANTTVDASAADAPPAAADAHAATPDAHVATPDAREPDAHVVAPDATVIDAAPAIDATAAVDAA